MGEGADSIGAVATAGLVAREIERARVGAPALGHAADEPCANCGMHRHGPYCHQCGQAGHVHRSLGALIHDLAHGVFHFEGKFWSTLPLLALKPGELTRRYVHGERAKFVSPVALFLFSVFLMFAVVSTLAGHGGPEELVHLDPKDKAEIATERAKSEIKLRGLVTERARLAPGAARDSIDERIDETRDDIEVQRAMEQRGYAAAGTAGIKAGQRAIARDAAHIDSGSKWLDAAIGRAAANPEFALYKMKSYAYKYSWAMIPISLPFLWLLFVFRRDVGLYDHAIFAIYSLSFMSLGVVALVTAGRIGVPTAIITLAAMIVPPIHMYRQLKGAYGLSRLGALWRTAALVLITAITLTLFLMFLFWLGSE